MANDFSSHTRRKFGNAILKGFFHERNLSREVDVQALSDVFADKQSGEEVDFRRPTDYRAVETPDGDVSAETENSIIHGKATGRIQPYITVFTSYKEADQAVKMYKKKEYVDMPMARRLCNKLETNFGLFMMRNSALVAGTPGTPLSKWDDVSRAHAMMNGTGVPMDSDWCMGLNPFTQVKLAGGERSLGVNPQVKTANDKAVINENYGGMRVMTVNTMGSYRTGVGADRSGALLITPDATYSTAKDTFQQSFAVTGFQANLEVKAGEVFTAAGANRLNLGTRTEVFDENGASVPWQGIVAQDVTLDGTGAGVIVVNGPAINEADGQYNTVDAALASSAIVTLGGAANTAYQPNLFWHKQAFSIGSVPMEKLDSQDTIVETEDGIQIRITYGSEFLKNRNLIRLDIRPAYAALNQFFAGHAYGTP